MFMPFADAWCHFPQERDIKLQVSYFACLETGADQSVFDLLLFY